MEPSSHSIEKYSSMLAELIRHGFSESRAMKALICSGYLGFDAAFQWLVNHSRDPRLDVNSREFIFYLIPSGELHNQIRKFYEASFEECGWSSMHNFIPHISLTPYFQVPSDAVPLLIEMVKDNLSKDCHFSRLLENIPLERYASQNFIGLYIKKSSIPIITSFLKEIKSNMDLHLELKGHSFKESEKKFHLSLAYHFAAEKYSKLCSLVNTLIDPNSQCKWELQLYSRDKYFAQCQVYKVMHSSLPKRPIELELKKGDFIYVSEESESVEGEGVKGTSWLTGVSGIINTNLIERTAISDTWTSYLGSGQTDSASAQSTLSPVKSLENKTDMKNIYIMRHGERIDFTFSRNWLPLSSDKKDFIGNHDMSNNNSIPLKSETAEEIITKKGSDFSKERSNEAHKTDDIASNDNGNLEHSSQLKRETIDSLVEDESPRKELESEYCPTVKKQFIPKKRKKGEEFRKKTKTTSYFKKRLKGKPMSGGEIETTIPLPDSQNNNGLLSRKLMSKERNFESLASTSNTVSPTIDQKHVSETLLPKEVTPSSLKFGFLGIGHIGSCIVKNLLNTGHIVYIWNRTLEKCEQFKEYEGAEILSSPCDVVSASDITFCCVSDKNAAKEVVFGNCGVVFGMNANKAYVEMSGIDAESSNDIAETIVSLGGRYLEVRLQGSYKDAIEGSLIIVAAGDRLLYDECSTCFFVCSKQSLFLGEEVGNASNMNLVVQLMYGVSLAGVAEGMALAHRCGLNTTDLIEILKLSSLNCPFLINKCISAVNKNFEPDLTLKNLQKDINMALALGDSCDQSLVVTANANELYKQCKQHGCKNMDSSVVIRNAKL